MNGLTMDYQLTVPALLRRAEALFGAKRIVSRLPDKSYHRYTYADMVDRAKRLAVALQGLGVQRGDRVATLAWNHYQHLEAYLGIPVMGGVLHTLNLRLHPHDLTYIVNHAEDRVILVDEALLPLLGQFRDAVKAEHIVVISEDGEAPEGMLSYEALLATAKPSAFRDAEPEEREAAAMCYTSGTTGRPKAVLYSHRAIVLHSLVAALPDMMDLSEGDTTCPVVPMFHANAWGMPFTSTLIGANQVFPGPHLDPTSLLQLLRDERVTMTAGVPTIWMGILQTLDRAPGAYDLSALRTMIVGGQAAPRSLIEGFRERHGLNVVHAWGMTEMAPLGTVSRLSGDLHEAPPAEQYAYRATQGRPGQFIEVRARGGEGLVPWDGVSMGELEVRGPWVASAYYNSPEGDDRWTDDGWFRTGDIVTIDARGYVRIQDRSKDVIKSGGEWISSVELENALMGHPAVAEAAVIAIPHERWGERPLAVVVLREGQDADEQTILAHLEPDFARWWIPDGVAFVAEIPKTSVGKFQKSALRERFHDHPSAPKASEPRGSAN